MKKKAKTCSVPDESCDCFLAPGVIDWIALERAHMREQLEGAGRHDNSRTRQTRIVKTVTSGELRAIIRSFAGWVTVSSKNTERL